jgi:hypothetical protein
MGLSDELIALERQAATVASYLDPDDKDLLQRLADAFAPLPGTTKGSSPAQRERWRRDWVVWLLECGERFEARPVEPSADDLHRLIVRWVVSHHS